MKAATQPVTPFERLREWLTSKLDRAEADVRARAQMEQSWRKGTTAEWEAAAQMHPSTAGKPVIHKADRIKEADAQGRIAEKCRGEAEMFKAMAALLNSHAELLKALRDLLEEYKDRQAQWGGEYLWEKHEDPAVISNAETAIASAEKGAQ